MKHRISEVDGNDIYSDYCRELMERDCYNVLPRIVKCVVSLLKKSVINTCTSVQANAAKSCIKVWLSVALKMKLKILVNNKFP